MQNPMSIRFSPLYTIHYPLAALLCLLLAGCGPGNPLGRKAVSGKVHLDGAPLDRGTIAFAPQSGAGVSSGAVIRDGAYSIPLAKGLPPGKYLVRINSAAPNPAENDLSATGMPGAGGLPGVERIAPAYNIASKTVIEVVPDAAAEFSFDTKSK